jgi:hypothetical protein
MNRAARPAAATSTVSAPITDPPHMKPTNAGATTAIHALPNPITAAIATPTGTTPVTL